MIIIIIIIIINNNTGNPFRSSDLGVMSPARFLCAMPVKTVLCKELVLHTIP